MGIDKVGSYSFVAEPFHVDFTGRLTMGVLGNHLLNCAGFHAADRGFGIATLNESHYTWVLSRLAIELTEQYTRMYYDLSINMEGIDAIHHLLGRMEEMQKEIARLRNRLSLYEEEWE